MVLKPVLYNNSNPNTFNTYISSQPGNQPSSSHIRATMFSPEETPTEPRTCMVILSSEEKPTNRAGHLIIWNYTIYTFLSNNISYNTIAGWLGCFIGWIHNNFILQSKHVCSSPEYTSDWIIPPVTAGDRHQSGGSYPQRSHEVAMATSDHCLLPISTIHQPP